MMEVGNEPDYPIEMYSEILLGMARGAKHADPAMKVLPGVPYIAHQGVPWYTYLTAEHLMVIDGLNSHAYRQAII